MKSISGGLLPLLLFVSPLASVALVKESPVGGQSPFLSEPVPLPALAVAGPAFPAPGSLPTSIQTVSPIQPITKEVSALRFEKIPSTAGLPTRHSGKESLEADSKDGEDLSLKDPWAIERRQMAVQTTTDASPSIVVPGGSGAPGGTGGTLRRPSGPPLPPPPPPPVGPVSQ